MLVSNPDFWERSRYRYKPGCIDLVCWGLTFGSSLEWPVSYTCFAAPQCEIGGADTDAEAMAVVYVYVYMYSYSSVTHFSVCNLALLVATFYQASAGSSSRSLVHPQMASCIGTCFSLMLSLPNCHPSPANESTITYM